MFSNAKVNLCQLAITVLVESRLACCCCCCCCCHRVDDVDRCRSPTARKTSHLHTSHSEKTSRCVQIKTWIKHVVSEPAIPGGAHCAQCRAQSHPSSRQSCVQTLSNAAKRRVDTTLLATSFATTANLTLSQLPWTPQQTSQLLDVTTPHPP